MDLPFVSNLCDVCGRARPPEAISHATSAPGGGANRSGGTIAVVNYCNDNFRCPKEAGVRLGTAAKPAKI